MKTPKTRPARKEYFVFATCNRHVYQRVTAASPGKAYRIASDQDDDWQESDDQDWHAYVLSKQVMEVETGEMITVGDTRPTHCKTCGSEIVETINESNLHDGECGPCECERYRSQPALREHLEAFIEIAASVSGNRENGNAFADALDSLDRIAQEAKAALAPYGEAA
jgi:hypothetical protein